MTGISGCKASVEGFRGSVPRERTYESLAGRTNCRGAGTYNWATYVEELWKVGSGYISKFGDVNEAGKECVGQSPMESYHKCWHGLPYPQKCRVTSRWLGQRGITNRPAEEVVSDIFACYLYGQRGAARCWKEAAYICWYGYGGRGTSNIRNPKDNIFRCDTRLGPIYLQTHVDAVEYVGMLQAVDECLIPAMEKCFKISNRSIIKAPKHCEKLCQLLGIDPQTCGKKCPLMPGYTEVDTSSLLKSRDACVYRTCIGILLYLASDLIESQNAVRYLSQEMSGPSVRDMKMLRHLVSYLASAAHQGLLFTPEPAGSGLMGHQYEQPWILKRFLTLTGPLISVTGSLFPARLSACKGMSCILRQGLRDA